MQANVLGALGAVLALLLGFGMLQVGNTLQGTLLAVRGGLEGFSSSEIGVIGSGFSAGLVLGSLRVGAFIGTVGHTRTFAALASIVSAAALLHLMVVHPLAWVAFRFVTGFCFAGILMVVESWLNGSATPEIRGRILSLYSMTGLIAGIGGQFLLPVADPGGFLLFCICSVILSFALVPVTLSRSSDPSKVARQTRIDLRRLYRQSPFGLVAAFLCGISIGAFYALGPLYAQRIGFSDVQIAAFMASATAGAFVTTWPFGWASDRMERRVLIVTLALLAAVVVAGMVVMLPKGLPPAVMYGLVFIFGALVLPIYSIVVAHVNDTVTPEEFVAASGGLLIVQGTGMATGPILGGMAMSAIGVDGLPWLIVAAETGIVLWGTYRMTRRSAPEGKEHFQPMPVATAGLQLLKAVRRG